MNMDMGIDAWRRDGTGCGVARGEDNGIVPEDRPYLLLADEGVAFPTTRQYGAFSERAAPSAGANSSRAFLFSCVCARHMRGGKGSSCCLCLVCTRWRDAELRSSAAYYRRTRVAAATATVLLHACVPAHATASCVILYVAL